MSSWCARLALAEAREAHWLTSSHRYNTRHTATTKESEWSRRLRCLWRLLGNNSERCPKLDQVNSFHCYHCLCQEVSGAEINQVITATTVFCELSGCTSNSGWEETINFQGNDLTWSRPSGRRGRKGSIPLPSTNDKLNKFGIFIGKPLGTLRRASPAYFRRQSITRWAYWGCSRLNIIIYTVRREVAIAVSFDPSFHL